MNKRLLNLHSLKFNPFSSQLPATALWVTPPIQSFCWRIEHQVGEGGFALAVGGSRGRQERRPAHPLRALKGLAGSMRGHLNPAPSQNGRLLPGTGSSVRRGPLAQQPLA